MNLCAYGCGRKAKYQLKNGKWCCSKSQNSCPGIKKKFSKAQKKRFSNKKNHPMFGQHHTEKTRKLMRENHVDISGPNHPMFGKKNPEHSKRMSGENNPFYRKKHTKEIIRKRSGKNCHWWNPDREQVFAPYTEKFYNKEFRKQILKEQKYICPICNKKLKGRKELHHIDNNKQNDNKENLIFLHSKCHNRTKGSLKNRNYWKIKLEKIVGGNKNGRTK